MVKVYPVVKGYYRFLGGSPWNVPKQLWELAVSKAYEITPSGKDDFIVRGAGRPIMMDRKSFETYFEPFVDYFAEPTVVEKVEVEPEFIYMDSDKKTEEGYEIEQVQDKEQLSFFG